jgi:hypothetical protein
MFKNQIMGENFSFLGNFGVLTPCKGFFSVIEYLIRTNISKLI